MKKARIVIGANYGDEGKGTVVANYTKNSKNVLNILTNGGAQRGHSILTEDGSITFQHFGAGTYHGADNYYSCFFILCPMQFYREHKSLIIKPKNIYRDARCRWSTPYDIMANIITEELLGRHASCGMGIWNTIKRCNNMPIVLFDDFINMKEESQSLRYGYLNKVKEYYEKALTIPDSWKDIWNSTYIMTNFIEDCEYMYQHTKVCNLSELDYDNLIFENGQGLLLSDTGKDTYDTTPSNTGIKYSLELLKDIKGDIDVEAHYVTRPYLTRHGDGYILKGTSKSLLSSNIEEDRVNHNNEFQGEFRYGALEIPLLKERILSDAGDVKVVLDVTHCDEMDRLSEFMRVFNTVNPYNTPLV